MLVRAIRRESLHYKFIRAIGTADLTIALLASYLNDNPDSAGKLKQIGDATVAIIRIRR